MMTSALKFLQRFRRDARGLAAIEFALIAPLMLVSLLGAVELSNAMLADRKATQSASTLADLVSQDTEIVNAEVPIIFDATSAVIYPVTPTGLGMRVTSIVADAGGVTRVAWSEARGMTRRARNQIVAVPAGMVSAGGSVILAEVQFSHDSTFADVFAGLEGLVGSTFDPQLKSGWTMAERFYLRPRRSITVERSAS